MKVEMEVQLECNKKHSSSVGMQNEARVEQQNSMLGLFFLLRILRGGWLSVMC